MDAIVSIKEVKLGQDIVSSRLRRIVTAKIIAGGVNPWAHSIENFQISHIPEATNFPESIAASELSSSSDSWDYSE